ncbi:MAG TPA: biopolymer transporter ExbD [Oligoflexia bacterium]|nr:biopolymer transporter ExbD [Oligoflexia bacterium]HMR24586.1 biopolymer transporter ExbD [Oligoflexia bacterium]
MAFNNDSNNNNNVLAEINVTPLVDVMLVLLIIFMVAAPLIQQQVDVELPETQAKQSIGVKENDVVLIVDKYKKIHIQGQSIALENLEAKLKAIYKTKEKKEIFLQADKSIPYGFVVQIMALVKNAGINKMGMVTDGPQQS